MARYGRYGPQPLRVVMRLTDGVPARGRAFLRALVLVLGAALAAAVAVKTIGPLVEPVRALPVLGQTPQFSHLDQDGRSFSTAMLADKVWIASFLYTTCPGPCPILARKVKRLQDEFGSDPRFRLVSFSVDPERDTSRVLKEYAERHGADPRTWSFLTGEYADMIATIRKGFYLDASRASELAAKLGIDDAEKYLEPMHGPIVHSLRVVLIDGKGRIRGYYDTNDPEALTDLVRDTRRLLSPGTKS